VESRSRSVAERFAVGGRIVSVAPLGDGHINATYEVRTASDHGRRYVLQRINRGVFRDPGAVIRNAERVIRHIEGKVREEGRDPEREVLQLIPTLDGGAFLRDGEGEIWRCYAMIEGATAHSTLAGPDRAYTVARAFGRFLRWLADFPPHELEITLPGFHDTPGHLRALREATRSDRRDRLGEVGDELAFAEDRREAIVARAARLSAGGLPVRAIHNDTKISNVLVDDGTGRGICVIDLDTVMPGSAVVDIADCARSALTRVERPGRDPEVFAAVVRGYLAEIGGLLSEAEVELIVEGTWTIALELGIRFLTDFIVGDRWFPVAYPTENLNRCRGQLRVVQRIEKNEAEWGEIVRRAASRGPMRRGPTTDALRFRVDGGRTRA